MKVHLDCATSAPLMKRCKDPIPVERRLNKVCKKLNITEVNIGLFHKMIKNGVVTNDVRSFIQNQRKLKKSAGKTNFALGKAAMRSKLNDACSTAGKLRREKRSLKMSLASDCHYTKSKTRRVMNKIMKRASNFRNQQRLKVIKKFDHCKERLNRIESENEKRDIPDDVWKILGGVNIFNKTVNPEQPADPMVCSDTIKLSRCEKAFLRKGPKYMLRNELNESEFVVDLYKMVIKEKYDKVDSLEDGSVTGEGDKKNDLVVDEKVVKEIEAKARLVYNKEDLSLNLGRMRASDYKYNKMIYLPKIEDSRRESLHEVRKEQMLKVFNEVKGVGEDVRDSGKGAVRRLSKKVQAGDPPNCERGGNRMIHRRKEYNKAYKRDSQAKYPTNLKRDSQAKYPLNDDQSGMNAETDKCTRDNERDSPAKYAHSDERALLCKYTMDNERDSLAKYEHTRDNERDSPAKYTNSGGGGKLV